MSSAGLTTIHVPLKASPTLRGLSVLGHGLAGAALIYMARIDPLWWVGLAPLAFLAHEADRRFARARATSWIGLRWHGDHQLHWTMRSGATGSGECIEARAWGNRWVRLRARDAIRQRRIHDIVIPRDATTADSHRRLRVRCRVAPPRRDKDDEA